MYIQDPRSKVMLNDCMQGKGKGGQCDTALKVQSVGYGLSYGYGDVVGLGLWSGSGWGRIHVGVHVRVGSTVGAHGSG